MLTSWRQLLKITPYVKPTNEKARWERASERERERNAWSIKQTEHKRWAVDQIQQTPRHGASKRSKSETLTQIVTARKITPICWSTKHLTGLNVLCPSLLSCHLCNHSKYSTKTLNIISYDSATIQLEVDDESTLRKNSIKVPPADPLTLAWQSIAIIQQFDWILWNSNRILWGWIDFEQTPSLAKSQCNIHDRLPENIRPQNNNNQQSNIRFCFLEFDQVLSRCLGDDLTFVSESTSTNEIKKLQRITNRLKISVLLSVYLISTRVVIQ